MCGDRREGVGLGAFRAFVRFAQVWFCLFPLPLSILVGLRLVVVALPGPFSCPFIFSSLFAQSCY